MASGKRAVHGRCRWRPRAEGKDRLSRHEEPRRYELLSSRLSRRRSGDQDAAGAGGFQALYGEDETGRRRRGHGDADRSDRGNGGVIIKAGDLSSLLPLWEKGKGAAL